MTSDEDQPTQAEREAALFGPPGRGEYRRGDTLRFKDPQSGEHLAAKVIYVRAPAPAVQGGKVPPTVYLVYVQGEHLLRAIYSSDVIEKAEPHRNTGS